MTKLANKYGSSELEVENSTPSFSNSRIKELDLEKLELTLELNFTIILKFK